MKNKVTKTEPSDLAGKWTPKLILSLRNYTRRDLISDLVAGLTVGLVALPLAMAFGIASGASPQIKDFLGLRTAAVPSEFIPRMRMLAANLHSISLPALGVGIGSLAVILLLPRFSRRIPASIVALAIATNATIVFKIPLETIGTKFGGIPTGLPKFSIPEIRADLVIPLLPAAVTVAMLAAIESLLSAVVADGMSGDKHNSNVELLAQGIANIAVPLFGGIPATGLRAPDLTFVAVRAIAPVAGIIHALTLLMILLV